jgi:alkane 1-monooxygenase
MKRSNLYSYASKASPFFYYTPLILTLATWYASVTYGWSNLFVYTNTIYIFGVISLLDMVVGPTSHGIYEPFAGGQLQQRARIYQGIVLSALPIFVFLIWWGCYVYSTHNFTLMEKIGWAVSVGVLTTIFSYNAAHEMVHKNHPVLQMLGGVLFSLGLYGGAKVSHIRSHHVLVATPEDPTSARRGQTLYGFLPRAIWVNVWGAWKIQMRLLEQRHARFFSAGNEMLLWTLISGAVLFGVNYLFGFETAVYYVAQCFVGVVTLEMTNYVAHYGLQRKRLANGRYENVALQHSWNCDFIFNNLMSLNVQRHTDHHKYGPREYQLLRSLPDSPQLPQGYTVLAALALIPPVWTRYMKPYLDQLDQEAFAIDRSKN